MGFKYPIGLALVIIKDNFVLKMIILRLYLLGFDVVQIFPDDIFRSFPRIAEMAAFYPVITNLNLKILHTQLGAGLAEKSQNFFPSVCQIELDALHGNKMMKDEIVGLLFLNDFNVEKIKKTHARHDISQKHNSGDHNPDSQRPLLGQNQYSRRDENGL